MRAATTSTPISCFKWLREARLPVDAGAEEAACFLPAEIVGKASPAAPVCVARENRIEIKLAGGHSLKISGAYDPDALARLIRSHGVIPIHAGV